MKKSLFLVFILAIVFPPGICFSQYSVLDDSKVFIEQGGLKPENVEQAFERAMKKVEKERTEKREILTGELKARLDSAIQEWMNEKIHKKNSEINRFVNQDWYKSSKVLPVPPIHEDYILRDFAYIVDRADIIETDSMAAPYKAHVVMQEKLYLEKNHAASISYRNTYFYTVTSLINLNLEYRGNRFVAINSDEKLTGIENRVPQDIASKILKQAFD
ncbi:MAG: hypothetical protein PHO70_00650 [Candidatus Omnitrophica bacterium]|nr:hypothetical protein [Candidatus Omnitrophota bacterium]